MIDLGDLYNGTAEPLIQWVDDRFGRVAAWIVAAASIVLPFAGIVMLAAWWLS